MFSEILNDKIMKTITRILITIVFTSILFTPLVYTKPDARIFENGNQGFINIQTTTPIDVVTIQQVTLDPNNISAFIINKGIFNQNVIVANQPGFEWPKGSNKFACFTAGLSISAKINGQLRQAMASYSGEYAQGYINGIGGSALRDSTFRIYWIESSSTPYNNPDYAQWGNMVPFGAPYIDNNNNGQYDPGIDKPGIKNAEQTLFVCLTDGFPEEHNVGEGFGGGTLPMFAQVQLTAWGYDKPGLGDLQFMKWVVVNKNSNAWDSTFMGIVVDPDLGRWGDDYIGCDTNRNLGYCYNADDDDDLSQSIYAYGPNPPAFGMDLLSSLVNQNVSPHDTIGMSSFIYFTCVSCGGPPCEYDPNGEPVGAYNMLQGLKKDRTPWYNPMTGLRIKFCYPGYPETQVGWTEYIGSVMNCNGDSLTGSNVIPVNSPGDRRMVLASGNYNLSINPGDTQTIVLAQLIARGSNFFNTMTKLRALSDAAQNLYNSGFVIGVEPISSTIPINYRLHQNYPNPFNPTTKIKFEIPSSSHMRMIIYDLLGQEVTTLVNKKLKPGTYEVTFDGSNYASGVYFYSLVADDFINTKKMLLVK
jgi:hypothetical protein